MRHLVALSLHYVLDTPLIVEDGLIKNSLYGAYAGLVHLPIYNFLDRKLSVKEAR